MDSCHSFCPFSLLFRGFVAFNLFPPPSRSREAVHAGQTGSASGGAVHGGDDGAISFEGASCELLRRPGIMRLWACGGGGSTVTGSVRRQNVCKSWKTARRERQRLRSGRAAATRRVSALVLWAELCRHVRVSSARRATRHVSDLVIL